MFGGRSIIDPDGFPFSAKQTALLERLTPRSEGGPNPNTDPSQENENPYSDPDKLSPEQKKEIAAAKEKALQTFGTSGVLPLGYFTGAWDWCICHPGHSQRGASAANHGATQRDQIHPQRNRPTAQERAPANQYILLPPQR